MNFYLVRHGDAVSEAVDPRRPLSRIGQADVEQLARAAAARNVQVSAILHSGILRAQQTAEILAAHLASVAEVRPTSGLSPEDDPAIAKAELEAVEQPVMLVGHLPHMSRLKALLIHGDSEREAVGFAPATMVCVAHEDRKWKFAWLLAPQPK